MEVYSSEEEQLDAIKHWWRENSTSVIAGLVLGVVLVLGYSVWKERRQHMAERAAGQYQQLVKAMEANQVESADRLSERLIQEYDATSYGAFARLAQAKIKTDAGDLAAARHVLEGLLASSVDDKVKHLARLRLVQVMLDSNEAQAALGLIEQVRAKGGFGAFERDYELLKGDSYSAYGRTDDARIAYQAAQRLGAADSFLEMKMDELGASLEPAH